MAKAPGFDGTQPCAAVNGDMFFPETGAETIELRPVLNKICNSCQFQTPCLQYALENAVQGFWAGTVERERRLMRRRLKIAVKPLVYY